MTVTAESLRQFHPLVAQWFRARVGQPTDVQAAAWPQIAAGEHVLITAPTGSGKTLTAFLWALNQLVTGAYPRGRCSVLYISPLKALNNDIQRNLLAPLEGLRQVFEEAGEAFPDIRVLTRSGDTPAAERQRMLRRPPEILITTPESLNLLLSSRGGMTLLGTVQTVILDEIHAVIDTKRGVHLMTGVERLVRLCGEFQRIALSATIRPLELVAQFVGGYQRLEADRYAARPVALARSARQKAYQMQVRFPLEDKPPAETMWTPIVQECAKIVEGNRSTLLFTNTRRLAEMITWKLNEEMGDMLAYAHHGALAREIRTEVERRLKDGRLRAIVATNSLEMGIDIGTLDEVVLIQSPPNISSAIQRVGRAGHQVGEVSRATLFASHSHDVLKAAVLAPNIVQGNIEEAHAIRGPLDVLAQVIISMTGVETWDIDELFAELRRSYPFHELTRTQFDLVLNMLAGRYAETRIRELKARVSLDKLDNTVSARPGALQELYQSGGMIPDRGSYHLRHLETNAIIGELDEEYVWEADLGQTLTFGTQNWRIERITHNDVFVVGIGPTEKQAPFWRGEQQYRDFHFSEQIGLFLEEANTRLAEDDFPAELQATHYLEPVAATALADYLQRQRESCRCDLPHRHHLLVEHVIAGPDGYAGNQVVIHTGWGGRVNVPFALALAAAWEERFGSQVEISPSDDAVYLLMADEVDSAELLAMVQRARLDELLRRKLEGSGFFGARFRECAGRALLLTRRRRGERLPLWVSRLRSKRLLEAVLNYPDFPMLLETWRCCLQDEFDLEHLRQMLGELETGAITWSEVRHDTPSPFTQTTTWQQINKYMYADDTPTGRTTSHLRGDLLQEVVFTPGLRPSLAPALVARFVAKRQRLAEGYAPQSPRDLLDWVRERLLIPASEWRQVLQAVERDHGLTEAEALKGITGKLAHLHPAGAREPLVAAKEQHPRLRALWQEETGEQEEGLTDLLAEWLRFYGPVSPAFIVETLGLPPMRLAPLLDDLLDTQKLIQGQLLRDGAEGDLCDSENFEILLRMARVEAVPSFTPLPLEELPLFLAQFQGLCAPGEDQESLWGRLEQLSGYAAPAEQWEEVILPARLSRYQTAWLDSLLQEGQLRWLGAGKRKVYFALEEELDLLREAAAEPPADDLRDLLPDLHARYSLQALAMRGAVRLQELVGRLWDGVWSGVVSNDAMAALRKGIINDFAPPALPEVDSARQHGRRRVSKSGFTRWVGAAPFAGNWYRLPDPVPAEDLLEESELAKDRVRLLLARYGLLCREIVQHEQPLLQWPRIFRALRLMELAGEVVGGCFFHGIPGLQFISHQAFRHLQRPLPAQAVWWVNACDPVSPCGLGLEGLKGALPRRVPGNFLIYRSATLVLTVLKQGKELIFHAPPDDPRLPEYFAPLHVLLERQFQPVFHLTVETINGEAARHSPYLDALAISFEVVRDYNRVFLSRRMR